MNQSTESLMHDQHPRWNEFLGRLQGPDGCSFRLESGKLAYSCECASGLNRARNVLDSMGADMDSSLSWLHQHRGHCDCEVVLAVVPAARQLLQLHESASAGDPAAMVEYGLYCKYERDGFEKDACDWFLRAADAGCPLGAYWYGLSLIEGEGAEADHGLGMQYLRLSAERGCELAMADLGAYLSGRNASGTSVADRDALLALQYLSRASALGVDEAFYDLATICADATAEFIEPCAEQLNIVRYERAGQLRGRAMAAAGVLAFRLEQERQKKLDDHARRIFEAALPSVVAESTADDVADSGTF